MSFITSMFSTPSAPALSVVTPAKAAPKETDADIIKERQERMAQAQMKNVEAGAMQNGNAEAPPSQGEEALAGQMQSMLPQI